MDTVQDRILTLFARIAGRPVTPGDHDDLFANLGLDGDDAEEVLEAFSKEFGVDMHGYLWYFHRLDEPPIYRRVLPYDAQENLLPFIPVSLEMLVSSANTKRWQVTYPTHTTRTSKRRIYTLVLGVLLILAVYGVSRII